MRLKTKTDGFDGMFFFLVLYCGGIKKNSNGISFVCVVALDEVGN